MNGMEGCQTKEQEPKSHACCHACRHQPSSCRHAGGSRTAKRTPVARAVRMMCIVTSAEDSSEPVGKEQCYTQQNMNYVALTAHNI